MGAEGGLSIYLPRELAEELANDGLVDISDPRPVSTWAIGGFATDAIVVVGVIASVVTLVDSSSLHTLGEKLIGWLRRGGAPDPESGLAYLTLSIHGPRGRVRLELVGDATVESVTNAIAAALGRPGDEDALPEYEDVYKVAFDEARRGIDQQLENLDSLHGRMGQLFSAAAVTGGILVGVALGGHRADNLSIGGAIAFAVAAAAFGFICGALVYVWDFTKGNFSLDPDTIIYGYIEAVPAESAAQIYRDLARWMKVHRANNGVPIDKRRDAFRRASIAFAIELVALGVALWDVVT
jgi:hypothetical protein